MSKVINLAGQAYGRWTVLGPSSHRGRNRNQYWECRCSCGTEQVAGSSALRSGHSKSCGCLNLDAIRERNTANAKHGCSRSINGKPTPTWGSWNSMINRCKTTPYNIAKWPDYAGRGILVCERWLGRDGFTHFAADMGERPDGMTLDRINFNGNYEPGNCRWATPMQQTQNRRKYGHIGKFTDGEIANEHRNREMAWL